MKAPVFISLSLILSLLPLSAGPGHDHGPAPGEGGGSASGPVELSDSAIQNLGISVAEAVLAPLQKQLGLPARLEPLPEKDARISARFDGTVLEVLAKLGEQVKKGQPLLKLDPNLIGNPPVIYRAPLDGTVTQVQLSQGQAFSTGDLLMQVSDYREMLVRGTAYDRPELGEIKAGQKASIVVDVFPGQTFTGTVQRLDAALDSQALTFEVYVLLDNQDLGLRPHQQARMFLGLGEASEVLSVPSRAVLGELGNFFVFVKQGNLFERRSVTLGIKSGDRVEIVDGVLPGEEVVTHGNYQIQYASPKAAEGHHDDHGSADEHGHSHVGKWIWIFFGLFLLLGLGAFFFLGRPLLNPFRS
jgi:membrane fusion protein, heavy metal efflux system